MWTHQLAVGNPNTPSQCGDPLLGFGSIVSPAYANGLLYAAGGLTPGGDNGSVVALDPATGAVRFEHATPGYVIAAMALVGDVLFVASNTNRGRSSTLEILDARTGVLLRTFTQPSATVAAPSVSGGTILWVTFQGHLTALSR